jgi:dipeptidyl aminopeptidase/acylaminoacyl peptidase
MKGVLKSAATLFALYLVAAVVVGIFLAEAAMHGTRAPIAHQYDAVIRERVALQHAKMSDVAIATSDNVQLRAWYIEPEHPNGRAVALFHGVTDTRRGVAGFGELFLANGYSILLPDARGHGESGGAIATYGVLEAKDIALWADWLKQKNEGCIYGFGESMGAGLVLQSLREHAAFCAVIAESPFSDFRHAAYDRIAGRSGVPRPLTRILAALPVEIGFLYARARYGIDFSLAPPQEAVAHSSTPVLLIHGLADQNLLPDNTERIQHGRANDTDTWFVPGAAHCGAWSTVGDVFNRRVLSFFQSHSTEVSRATARQGV